MRRIASLQEQDLGNATAAFEVWVRAVRQARAEAGPLLGEGLQELSRLADALGLHAEEAATLQEISPDLADGDQRIAVSLRIAEIARDRLGDRTLARDWYRRVLDAVPDHLVALEALEHIHREGREWEPLLEICERRAELAGSDADLRIEYLVKIGDLCEMVMGRPSEAIVAYEQIISLSPAEPRALAALERLYTSVERWPDLVSLLWRRVEHAAEVGEALDLRMRIGDLHADKLDDRAGALELYKKILADRADHAGAVKALEALLDDEELRAPAADALEPVYAAAQDWQGSVRVYEIQREVSSERDARRDLGTRIARIHEEQLSDQESAFAWYGMMWREEPTDTAARDQLIRLADLLDRYGEAVALFDDYLDATKEEDATSLEVARLAAQLLDDKLQDVDRARDYYLRILRAGWHDPTAQADIESCLTRHERWTDLVEVYREIAARTFEPDARRDLLIRLARVTEDRLAAQADAVPIWREVLDLDERDGTAIENLERLFAFLERDAELVELLVRQLEWAEGEARLTLKARLGPLYERLYDHGSAIDCYEEVLRERDGDADALAALERQLAQGDHRLRVALILQPVYEAHHALDKLVGVLEVKLEFEADPPERAKMLRRIAGIEDERGRPQSAFDALVRAFREEPASREIVAGLERLAGSLGRHAEMVRVLAAGVEEVYDAVLAGEIHGRIATVAEEQLQDLDLAIDAWQKRLAHNASDAASLDALDRLLGVTERFEEQIEILERKVQRRDDLDERKDLLRRIAALQETQLGRPDMAIQTWKSLLVFDESDAGALDALERMYEASAQWIELVWIYQRKMEAVTDPAGTRELRIAIARVYAEQLDDPFEAIGAYKAVLEVAPDDRQALAALDQLCERERVPSDLLEVLEAETRIAATDAEKDEFEIRAARLLLGELEDPHRAIGKLGAVLERTPSHAEARAALEELCQRDDTRPAGASVLESLYPRIGEWHALVELLETRLNDEVDPAKRADRLKEMARLREGQLDDRGGAMESYARALAEDPGQDDVNAELERLAGLENAWGRLASVYAEHVERALDGRLVFGYAMRLGRLQEEALGDDEAAAQAYGRALQVGLREIEALQALDRVYARSSRWSDLVDVIDRQARLASDAAERAGLLLRLGLVREQGLDDGEGALLAYRDALVEEPGNPTALEALERLMGQEALLPLVLNVLEPAYEALNQPRKRVDLLFARLGITRDARDRSRLLAKAAGIQETALDDQEGALRSNLRALDEWAEDITLLESIARLVDRTGHHQEAEAKLAEVLARGVTADPAKAAGLLRARWLHEKLGRPDDAETALRAVLDLENDCSEALGRLEQIARASGDARRLVEVLERRLEHEHSPDRRRPLLVEVAGLQETGLEDPEAALATWRSALDLDGRDAEAHASIVRLLETLDRPGDLGQALLDHALLPDDESERISFKRRSAQAFVKAGDLDRASDVYREILDSEPSDLATLEALEDIYGRRGDLASVKEILIRRMESMLPGPERIPVLSKLGRIAEEQGSSDEASVWYEQLRALEPTHEGGLERLEKLYEADQRWFELVTVLRERAEVSLARGDAASEVSQLARAAKLYEEKLGDAQQAVLVLERLLARDPENVGALSDLARLHQSSGQWERCLEILGRALGLAGSKPEAAELHYQMGKVRAEGLADPVGAEAHYARALEVQPGHGGALDALMSAARDRGDHARLAVLLEQREESVSDSKKRLEMLREIISLHIDRMGQPEAAVPALEKAAALAPQDVALARTLANLHFEAGRIDDAAAWYERVVEISGHRRPKDLAAVMRRLASIREQQGDGRESLRWYEEAHQLDATEGTTLAALGRIYLEREDWEKARRIFRAILLGNLDEAAGMGKGDVYYNLGRIHAHMGETAKALGMYERGLEIEPDSVRLRKAMEALRGGR